MPEPEESFNPMILDSTGKVARRPKELACPRCGAGPDKRVASAGFGIPHPVCRCGYEWHDEVFHG